MEVCQLGSSVTFKGTVNGLTIVMKDIKSFDDILADIEKKIVSSGDFFKGASLKVKYCGKKLNNEQQIKILKLLLEKGGVVVNSFGEETCSNHDLNTHKNDEGNTRFYRCTVRSGQVVSYNGSIVIIGDVNPGGQVVASGNVIVTGSLRGIVHAGSYGNKDACVVAYKLQPMQLRIADVIARAPDSYDNDVLNPEIAVVRDDRIYIEDCFYASKTAN